MRANLCGLVLSALALSFSPGQAELSPDHKEPDHLVPVRMSWDEYDLRLRGLFRLDAPFYLEMISLPAFNRESVMRLHGGPEQPKNMADCEKLFITYTEPNRSIYYAMAENNDARKADRVFMSSRTIEFPKALGLRVLKLWERVLKRTRHPKEPLDGFDGITIEFATPQRRGKVWTPMLPQSPQLLLWVGCSMERYCKSLPWDRKAKLREVEKAAAVLETYLDTHPASSGSTLLGLMELAESLRIHPSL